ncbi:development-specific protein LVN1.2-like [Asterias rubens]|uniref:development-specific protein LVN1.2-like n=1 Tax=Asterias rubens TaxID=7604 RepID=UPI001455C277|nr:development-specific protein LVN1.2-like [Asterias rubens]
MYFSTVCVFVLVAVTASAQTNQQGCCFPKQFEASIGQVNGLVLPTGTPIVQTNYIMGAFDFTNNRAGELIQTETMGKMSSIKVIVDYKENYMYTIIGKQCTKSAATGDFPSCTPKTAQFLGTYSIGDNQLQADSYSYYAKAPSQVEGNVSFSVTHDGCIPTGTLVIGKTLQQPSLPIMSSSGYLNYTQGIADPGKWFDIPDICTKTQLIKRSVDTDPLIQLANRVSSLLLPSAA